MSRATQLTMLCCNVIPLTMSSIHSCTGSELLKPGQTLQPCEELRSIMTNGFPLKLVTPMCTTFACLGTTLRLAALSLSQCLAAAVKQRWHCGCVPTNKTKKGVLRDIILDHRSLYASVGLPPHDLQDAKLMLVEHMDKTCKTLEELLAVLPTISPAAIGSFLKHLAKHPGHYRLEQTPMTSSLFSIGTNCTTCLKQ